MTNILIEIPREALDDDATLEGLFRATGEIPGAFSVAQQMLTESSLLVLLESAQSLTVDSVADAFAQALAAHDVRYTKLRASAYPNSVSVLHTPERTY